MLLKVDLTPNVSVNQKREIASEGAVKIICTIYSHGQNINVSNGLYIVEGLKWVCLLGYYIGAVFIFSNHMC